jgi:hypothetical protein
VGNSRAVLAFFSILLVVRTKQMVSVFSSSRPREGGGPGARAAGTERAILDARFRGMTKRSMVPNVEFVPLGGASGHFTLHPSWLPGVKKENGLN